MFESGKSYKAKLVDAGLSTTKGGDPQAFMKFQLIDGSAAEEFYWHGSFKEGKAQEITVKALITAGFAGSDVEELGTKGILAFMPADVTCELEEQTDKAGKGNGKLRVKWVNTPKQREAFKGATPKLAGAFAKAKQELGIKSKDNW
jgi:hypothetical protein